MTDAPPAPTAVAGPDAAAERLFQQIMMDPANENPYAGYHELRDRAPALITSDGTLVLTRHADCDAALRHRALGKGNEIQGFRLRPIPEDRLRELMDRLERSMSFANPPDHSRLRRVVSSAFTGRHIENLRPSVTARVDGLLDGLAAEPGADFMAGFAQRLPVGVVGDLLGVPEQDRSGFGAQVAALAAMVEPTADADTLGRAITAESELAAYFTELTTCSAAWSGPARRRASTRPRRWRPRCSSSAPGSRPPATFSPTPCTPCSAIRRRWTRCAPTPP
jgi:cytochrome P450